jgi:hypothetical protein
MRLLLGIFLFLIVAVGAGAAQERTSTTCQISGPWYWLNSDSVDWGMSLASGQSCLRGVRNNMATLDEIRLVSPPQNGRVSVEGPGFVYKGDAEFVGQDSFTLTVSGKINKIAGISTIHVTVWVRK